MRFIKKKRNIVNNVIKSELLFRIKLRNRQIS